MTLQTSLNRNSCFLLAFGGSALSDHIFWYFYRRCSKEHGPRPLLTFKCSKTTASVKPFILVCE